MQNELHIRISQLFRNLFENNLGQQVGAFDEKTLGE
jgi:hypothetical protein